MSVTATTSLHFTEAQLASVDPDRIPKGIAITMDGNRRWGKKNAGDPISGHSAGADVVHDIVEAARDLGVKEITLYTFSYENWDRPPLEVAAVMSLIENYLRKQKNKMINEGVRFGTIGELSRLPDSLRQVIQDVKTATNHCEAIDLVLALNYGSRNEITRAVRKIAQQVKDGTLDPSQIDESVIDNSLDTAPYADPDLWIRTSMELRISNFLLWQSSYSELVFVDCYWPEFTPTHLLNAVASYATRKRRYGT